MLCAKLRYISLWLPPANDKLRNELSLGEVKDIASVKVNGIQMHISCKMSFECNITDALKAGENKIEIDVTNLWPN